MLFLRTHFLGASTQGPAHRFQFKTAQGPDGRNRLVFPYMAASDLHLGTQYARAKRGCHMMQNVSPACLDLIGDLWDGYAVMRKKRWNLGPWQRQLIGHFFRRAEDGANVTAFKGNHEYKINRTISHDFSMENGRAVPHEPRKKPYRTIEGKSIYGMNFAREAVRTDMAGNRVLRLHGDKYDDQVFKSAKSRDFWYKIGDVLYTGLTELDRRIRIEETLLEHYSLAYAGKKLVKGFINERLGINEAIATALDKSDCEILIYGHSHMPGFMRTPGGKLAINDGCWTEHVNALVQDENGAYALITWHKDHIEVEEEPPPGFQEGAKYKMTFEELGLDSALEPVQAIEDAATGKADRLLRLAYRQWPSRDRTDVTKAIRAQRAFVQDLKERGEPGEACDKAAGDLEKLENRMPPVPFERPDIPVSHTEKTHVWNREVA